MAVNQEVTTRLAWIDRLRTLVIAGVIVVHAATAYLSDLAGWYYEERTTSEFVRGVAALPLALGAPAGASRFLPGCACSHIVHNGHSVLIVTRAGCSSQGRKAPGT